LKVVEVLRALPGEPVSLNATVDDGDAELIAKLVDHRVPRADRQIDSERSRARIHTLLHALPPREAAILTLRFGLEGEEELTLREVGERLNLSREHVRRIEERALAKLAPLLRATGSEESPD
jgi:RNA polymerase sigma factor (sigma-70 family)